jgi:hypothetical protein
MILSRKTTFFVLLCFAPAVLIAGSATTSIPGELQYIPPPPRKASARILGCEEASKILHNKTAFILSIDGKRVMAGRDGWNVPVMIVSGKHVLTVEFECGREVAQTDFPLEVISGATYKVCFSPITNFLGKIKSCDLWIADAISKEAKTSTERIALMDRRTNPVILPIFVRTRS